MALSPAPVSARSSLGAPGQISNSRAYGFSMDSTIEFLTDEGGGRRWPRRWRGALPNHLPRIEEVIAPDDVICGCGAERHIIGEDVSERLDIVPAQFSVIVTYTTR
jgi:hypothetical protein